MGILTYRVTGILAGFSLETIQARREYSKIFKVLKRKKSVQKSIFSEIILQKWKRNKNVSNMAIWLLRGLKTFLPQDTQGKQATRNKSKQYPRQPDPDGLQVLELSEENTE